MGPSFRGEGRIIDSSLVFFLVIVFIFAVLVLYIFKAHERKCIAELKATIRSQTKKLRKFRRKRDEVRKRLLVKEANGTDGVESSAKDVACGNKNGKIVVNREEWLLRGSDGFAETSGKWIFKPESKEQE
jgi:hypothetical protein